MQHTLLTLVTDMLGAIDAEGATSVTDTEESAMCVAIANRAYEAIIYKAKWKHLKQYANLVASDANNKLQGPSNTIHLDTKTVYYNGDRVSYMYPEDFIAMTQSRVIGTNVSLIGGVKCVTNQYPKCFTSFDDSTLVFDSTPTTSALTASDSNALVWVGPSSRISSDAQVFDMPAPAYPIIEDWAIGLAITELKGDATAGASYIAEAKHKLATMTQKGDLIEKNPDILRNIITRKSTINRRVN